MKKNYVKFLLLLIPILFSVLLYKAKIAQGPFSLGSNSDPSYVYLINSLNLAHGVLPGHVDHPGTISQYIGAIVLRISYFLDGTTSTIIEDVITKPETYLNYIVYTLIVLNSIALYLISYLAYKFFNKLWLGIYLQLLPFLFIDISIFNIIRVCSESLLWIFAASFSLLSVVFWFRNKEFTTKNKYIYSFALVLALAITNKITFIPFIIVPLLFIYTFKKKLYFLIITFLLLCLFSMPALFSYEYLLHWISGLLIKSGKYGSGNSNFIETENLITNIKLIIIEQKNLCFIFLCVVLTSFVFLFKKIKIKNDDSVMYQKLQLFLIAYFLIFFINILLIAKHYEPRYLMPLFSFSFGILPIFYLFLKSQINNSYVSYSVTIFAIISIFIMSFNAKSKYNLEIARLENTKQLRLKVLEKVKSIDDAIFLYYYNNSSPFYALTFGISYSKTMREIYNMYLHEKYPNYYEFNRWNNWCYQFGNQVSIKDILVLNKKIFILGGELGDSLTIKNSDSELKSFELKKVFNNKSGEIISQLLY